MSRFKKNPFHFNFKKKKGEREVLSYEELPLDEYEKEEKKQGVKLDKKKILIAMGIFLFLAIFIVVSVTTEFFTLCSGKKYEEFTMDFSGSKVTAGNFREFSDGIAYASDTSFVYVDYLGKEIFKEQLGFASPYLEVSEKTAMVYDLGSKGFKLFSDEGVTYSSSAEANIYLGDITEDGVYALVTDSSGYRAKLTVYNKDNSLRFEYYFADYYITSMSLSDDGKKAALCGVSAEGGSAVSMLYILDFGSSSPLYTHEVYSDTLFDCEFLSDKEICAVGSEATYHAYGKNFSELSKNSFSEMTLTAYDFNKNKASVVYSVSRSGDGRNCTVKVADGKGETDLTLDTTYKIKSLSTYEGKIALMDDVHVYLYETSGKSLAEREIKPNCLGIRLFSDKNFYLLGIDQIMLRNIG